MTRRVAARLARTTLGVTLAGWSFVVVACASEDATPKGSQLAADGEPGATSATATSERPEGSTTVSIDVAATTPNSSPAADVDGVVAAVALWRATSGNSWGEPDRFPQFYIVERLGHPTEGGDPFITGVESGRALTDTERRAIDDALAPRTVQWVESWAAVVDQQASTTLPEDRAIITTAEPTIEDHRAEVATELWCGFLCAVGSTSILAQSPDGEWTVTGQIGGYIS